MAELQEGKKLKRTIRVYGIEGPVYVVLTTAGICFQVPRTRHVAASMTWPEAVAACHTPENVPAAFYGKPIELLQRQVKEAAKRTQRRIDKKEKA